MVVATRWCRLVRKRKTVAATTATLTPLLRGKSRSSDELATSKRGLLVAGALGAGAIATAAYFREALVPSAFFVKREISLPGGTVAEGIPRRLSLPPGAVIEFVTDVEGNLEYFNRIIERSSILSWSGDDDGKKLQLADQAYFVYGGDAPDKGPADIRITRALVELQQQHPDRVFFIVGNRDCNKLRMAAELAPGEIPDVDPVSYLDEVSWEGRKQTYASFLKEYGLERGPLSGFRWLAEKTFGLGKAGFENRRSELQILGLPASDTDVVNSYRALVEPGPQTYMPLQPWTLKYLRVALVMLIIDDSLFIHGAMLSKHLLLLPAEEVPDGSLIRQPPPLRLADTTPIEQWAAELNSWKARQLRLFEAFPRFQPLGSEHRWRGGIPLMMPSLTGCHVITDGFNVKGNNAALENDVAAYLARNGIRRVFVGHQPQGWSPGITRRVPEGITVLNADTSFSDPTCDKSRNPSDMRGIAFSNVVITSDKTEVNGILPDGTSHGFTLHTDWSNDDEVAALVGLQLDDASWGRTVVRGQLQTFRGEGFKLYHQLMSLAEAKRRLRDEPMSRDDAKRRLHETDQ